MKYGHDAFKKDTELTVATAFADFMRFSTKNLRPGDDDEPDLVTTDSAGDEVGIEVTAGYYGDADARQLRAVVEDLARRGKRQTVMSTSDIGEEDLPPGVIKNPDAKLAANLQRAMDDHCRKRYEVPTFLVLDASWAPITSADDAPAMLAQLSRPADCPYVDVYLCLTENYGRGRLFFQVAPWDGRGARQLTARQLPSARSAKGN